MTLTAYMQNSLNEAVLIDVNFTEAINWDSFQMEEFLPVDQITFSEQVVTSEMFTFTYANVSTSAFRVTMQPKGYIFLYNVTIGFKTRSEPSPNLKAANFREFNPSVY